MGGVVAEEVVARPNVFYNTGDDRVTTPLTIDEGSCAHNWGVATASPPQKAFTHSLYLLYPRFCDLVQVEIAEQEKKEKSEKEKRRESTYLKREH